MHIPHIVQRVFSFFVFGRTPGPSGGVCRYVSWGTRFSLGTGGQLPARCCTEADKVISTQQTTRGKQDKQVLRCGLLNSGETFSTQGEQSDLDSQFADIQAAMEAYLSAATKPIANALR